MKSRFPLSVLYVTTGRVNPDGRLYFPPLVANQIDSVKRNLRDYSVIIINSWHPLFLLKKLIEIRRIIEGYDLIHAQYGSLTALISCLGKKDKPLVISFGGSDLMGTAGNGIQWAIRKLVTRKFGLLAAARSRKIIVKSEGLRMLLPDHMKAKATVVPNGVDIHLFHPSDKQAAREQLGWVHDGLYVLFTPSRANNVLVKNLPLAQEVLERASRLVDNISLELILDKSPAEVATMMNAADCLLLTSFHEGSPNVIKEAMACSLPIVTVNVGDVKDRLREVSNAHVVDSYVPEEICEKLVGVLRSNARTNGLEQIRKQKLTADEVALRILDIYHEVSG